MVRGKGRRGCDAGRRRPGGGSVQAGKRPGRLAGVGVHHEVAPQPGRQAAAGDALHRVVVVVAQPDAGHQIGGEAHEPGVVIVLRGAGLAGRRPVEPRRLAGAVVEHPGHHADQLRHLRRVGHRVGAAGLAAVEDLAAAVGDFGDGVGHHRHAAVGEAGVGARHLQQRHLAGAERQRQVAAEVRGDAELRRQMPHPVHPHPLDQPHRDMIAAAQQVDRGEQPAEAAADHGDNPIPSWRIHAHDA